MNKEDNRLNDELLEKVAGGEVLNEGRKTRELLIGFECPICGKINTTWHWIEYSDLDHTNKVAEYDKCDICSLD